MQEPTIEMQAKLYAALSKAQGEVDGASKTRMGQVGQQKYKYADLAAVEEAIGSAPINNGLAVIQIPGRYSDGCQELMTIVSHADGGFIQQMMSIPCQSTAQAAGSAITYLRRYALLAIFRILTEDDDGHAATNAPRPQGNPQRYSTPQYSVPPVNRETGEIERPSDPVEAFRQPSLGSLTGNQIKALVTNTKFPSMGIVGGYLANSGPAPIGDGLVEAWSEANPGADGMVLLRSAASYWAEKGQGKLKDDAAKWLEGNS